MLRVFVSYRQSDATDVAVRIAAQLTEDGHEVFRDEDPREGVTFGDDLVREIYQRVERADVVVAVVSPELSDSKWCFAELLTARALGKRIIPIRTEEGVSHSLIDPVVLRACPDGAGLNLLREHLVRLAPMAARRWNWSLGPPYPGLRRFEATEREVFFGRDKELRQLEERLNSLQRADRMVCVAGPSGSGKSSLLRAGFLPQLAQSRWLVAPLIEVGRTDPMDALAVALEECWAQAAPGERRRAAELRGAWLADPAGHVRDLIRADAKGRRLLLCFDQFEQAFVGDTASVAFLEALRALTTAPLTPAHCITTVRIEHVGRLIEAGWGDDTLFWLWPLRGAMLRPAITGPANAAELAIDDELVDRMVADAAGGDALPLLCTVLREMTIDLARGDAIDAARYRGLDGVLGRLADAAMKNLEGVPESVVLRALTRLATIDDADVAVRCPLRGDEIDASARAIYDAFAEQRLLVTTEDGGVDVAHEALFRAWRPLEAAVKADKDALRMQAELRAAAQQWNAEGRPQREYLWRGRRVESARAWLSEHQDAAEAVRAFIHRSTAADDAESKRVATQVANQVDTELDNDPELALLVLVEAAERYGASLALERVVRKFVDRATLVARITVPDLATVRPLSIAMPREGDRIAVLFDGVVVSTEHRMRKAAPRAPRERRMGVYDVEGRRWCWSTRTCGGHFVRFSPDGRRVLIADDSGLRVLNSTNGEELRRVPTRGAVEDAAYAARADRLAILDEGGLTVLHATTFEPHCTVWPTAARRVRLSPDGTEAVVYDPDTLEPQVVRFGPAARSEKLPAHVRREFLEQDVVRGAANEEALWEDWSEGTRPPGRNFGYDAPQTLSGRNRSAHLPAVPSAVATDGEGTYTAAAVSSDVVVHRLWVPPREPDRPAEGPVLWLRGGPPSLAEVGPHEPHAEGSTLYRLGEDGWTALSKTPGWPSYAGRFVAWGVGPVEAARGTTLQIPALVQGGMSTDGRNFYALTPERFEVHDTTTQDIAFTLELPDHGPFIEGPMISSPDGRFVALPFQQGDERRSFIIDLHNRQLLTNVRGRARSFSPTAPLVATVFHDTAYLVDLPDGTRTPLFSVYGHPDDLAFSPGGRLVAAACARHCVRVLEVESREHVAVEEVGGVCSVAFVTDEELLAGTDRGAIYRLPLPDPDSLLSAARGYVHRTLTPNERHKYGLDGS